MKCPFCGGDLKIHNEHLVDPMAECVCTPHLIRLSEVEAHQGVLEEEV